MGGAGVAAGAAGTRCGAGAAGGGGRGDQRAGRPGVRIPLGASDDVAAIAERWQFTMGEGPCVPACASGGAVVATGAMIAGRWPLLYQELIARTPYRAVLSLPLRYRPTGVGALDLHLLQEDGEATLGALPDVRCPRRARFPAVDSR